MILQVLLLITSISMAASSSSVSCDFGSDRGTLCAWHRTWENMERSNWKIKKVSKRFSISDHSGNNGYFLQYKPGKKYIAKKARIVSDDFTVTEDMCLSFWHFGAGSRYPYPKGMPKLTVSAKSLKGRKASIYRWNVATEGNDWQFIELQLDSASRQLGTDRIKLEITAKKGRKFKTVVGIDDLKVGKCGTFKGNELKHGKDLDLEASLSNKIIALPAHRIVTEVRVDAANFTNRQELELPTQAEDRMSLDRISRRRNKKRKNTKKNRNTRNRNRTEKYGIVYLPDLSQRKESDGGSDEPIQPQVLCDFIEYTQRIQGCIRNFFENMHNRRRSFSRKRCSSMYDVLESCLQRSAVSCIPELEISAVETKKLITKTLHEDLRMKEVYCEEEGAFVYPDYSFAALDLSCTANYFMKLSQCGTSFSSLFNIEHGDPHLCRKYYTANECQRQTIAEECNFDVATMIRYGLNLQYQFAHNPFCVKLPFSAWWPDT